MNDVTRSGGSLLISRLYCDQDLREWCFLDYYGYGCEPVQPSGQPTTCDTLRIPTPIPTSPTSAPSRTPSDTPTTSPIQASCNLAYDLDVAFLVDNSCDLTQIDCSQQQEGIAELLSSIKRSNNPRFMYVKFGNNYTNLSVSL